ncbi:MAG: SRPBCC family protein [Bacteroidota bacterium]
MAFYQLIQKQVLPATVDEAWSFIASPDNLQKITPKEMGFVVTSTEHTPEMYPGMIISYTVKPVLGIPLQWVTEITHVKEKSYFVDEQRAGPYAMWHHQHWIEAVDDGVLMTDIVSYKPPMGFLGSIANALFIKKKLNQIFSYRNKVLNEVFSKSGGNEEARK